MSNSSLDVLKRHKDQILLAEAGTLIHNIGKLSSAFVRKQGGDTAYNEFDHEPITGIINDYVSACGLSLSGKDRERLRRLNSHAKWPLTANLLSPSFRSWIKSIYISLPTPFDDRRYILADFIDFQSQRLYPYEILNLFPSGSRLTQLEAFAHGESSGLEKQESILENINKQPYDSTFIASTFGNEFDNKIKLANIDVLRNKLLDRLKELIASNSTDRYRKLVLELQSLQNGLGDTRRPANDVTLWDFNYSAACLLKPAIATVLLSGWKEPTKLRWCLLRINFDALGLYANAIKIADLLGYQERIDQACVAIKQLIEEEYPLGNEIYRDTTGIYFTFPDIPLPTELAKEIRRRIEEIEVELVPRTTVEPGQGDTAAAQLKRILADQRKEAQKELTQPFNTEVLNPCWQSQWENLPKGNWEVCPVCRLRPMKEHSEACEHCLLRRKSRIEAWRGNPTRTIWIDEIADHNDRAALIVGKFGLDDWLSGDLVQTMLVSAKENDPAECKPKNPAPSRLRRVWQTTQQFWEDTVLGLLQELPGRSRYELIPQSVLNQNVPPKDSVCDGTLDGQPVSVFRIGERFLTISFLEEPKEGKLSISWDENGQKKRSEINIVKTKKAEGELSKYQSYSPFLLLLSSPDQFMALLPASKALEIAERIQQEYARQFSKVQNRLPLFLGIIFFQRKMPLTTVMDTAKRMLALPQGNVPAKISDNVSKVDTDADGWPKEILVPLQVNGESANIIMKTVMGDDLTKDLWYPYWLVKGKPTDRKFYFELAGEYWVHGNYLKKGDEVQLYPSCFAYLYLEHTAQRFDFDPENEVILLDELPRLRKMWKDLKDWAKSGGSDTAIRGIQSLLESKSMSWGETSPEFEHLVKTTLMHYKFSDIVSPNDVKNGLFCRCLELHMRILKLPLKEKKHEQQPEATIA